MRCKFFLLFIVISFAGIFAQENYEPGVILLQVRQPEVVRFSNGQVINGSPQLQAVFQQYAVIRSRKLSHVNAETDGCYRIEFPLAFPLASIQSALTSCPDIKIVTLNHYGILAGIPNDPLWTDQWALQKIQMPKTWDVTKPSSTILIGIMDTGLDYTHVDLADNIWTNPNEIAGNGVDDDGNGKIDDIRGWDFVDADNNPQESALNHGTRVAGVIAARTYNGIGLAGIAGGWQNQVGVRLIGLRIVRDAFGGQWFQQEAKEAIDYLTWLKQQYGYTIIANMSFQTSGITDEPMPLFQASINAARNAGVIMVAAAGNVVNDPKSPYKQPNVLSLPLPARYLGVLAIGASQDGVTLQNELRSSYSLYDEAGSLLVVAPVDKTPSLKVVTTLPGNQYSSTFNGTSAACPMTVGVVALILSLNPNLGWSNLADILKSTAEKIGNYTYDFDGRTSEVGYGRINAYQALLLTHAYSNKSVSSTATAQNNGRRVVKTSDGKYHFVFESGITSGGNMLSEIFYRNSTDGVNWSTPVRLSAGNEQNRYPSITASGNTLYVVWQRKNGSTHDVYFATSQNSGTTWSNYVLAATSLAADPLPVIQAGVTANFSLMAIYRTNSGGTTRLVARRTTSVNPILSNWSAETTVPSTGANDFSPSPASTPNYWGQDANFGVAYATTAGQIQYRYYQHATGGWSSTPFNLSAIVPATNVVHQTPSLTGIPGSTSLHVAWYMEYTNNSGAYRHSIIHRKSNGFDNWPNVYTELFGDRFRPSITSVSSSTADLIFQYAVNDNGIAKMRYNGSSWGSVTTVSSVGKYPSVSTGSSNAKFVWTSGSSSPYTVNLSSETLSKSVSDQPSYSRSIAWLDSSGAYLEIQVHQIGVKLKNGTEQNLDFVSDSLALAQLTPANAWSFLAAVPSLLPVDAESLFVDYTVAANNLQSVANAGGNRYVSVNVKNINGHTVLSKTGLSLPSSGAIVKITQRLTIAVNTPGVVPLQVDVDVKGLTAKSTAFPSLGHIYDFTKLGQQSLPRTDYFENGFTPKTTVLFDNYPDPFNPETTIKYQILEASRITLKVYNIVGQEIRTLVDEVQDAGIHETRWDGKDYVGPTVPSGIYLYRMQAGEFAEVKKMVVVR